MKSLVIYHSNFGNTKLLAEEIAKVFGKEALLKHASDLSDNDFKSIGLLVVGSPIIGWMPSEPVKDALSNLGDGMLKGVRAASFDTRMKVFFHGDATKKNV